MLVDAHCHVDLFDKPQEIIEKAETNKIYTLAVTTLPSSFKRLKILTSGKKYIRAALGFHPELVTKYYHEINIMWQLFDQTRYIGEVGLDYTTTDNTERETQRKVFGSILEKCSEKRDRIISVHSRKAANDVVEAIGDKYRGVVILHWYTGSKSVLEKAISFGFYFSVNLNMLSSQSGKSILSILPKERVITETDAPFIKIGDRIANPTDISLVISKLSSAWGLTKDETSKVVAVNFKTILENK